MAGQTENSVTFTVKGKSYPLPDKMTFGDAALLRKVGVNLGELAIAVREGDAAYMSDPVVMGGLLLVSMKHAGMRVNPATLDELDINEVDVIMPDTVAVDDDPLASGAETSSEEAPAPTLTVTTPTLVEPSTETTPDVSGLLDSSTSSESTPGI